MFCSKCGGKLHLIKNFCPHCGVALSKKEAEENNEECSLCMSNVLLIAEKTNGSQRLAFGGSWCYTKWIVFRDGNIQKEVKYDDKRNWKTGVIEESKPFVITYFANEELLTKIKNWADKTLPNIQSSCICDGYCWYIDSYDCAGEKLLHAYGLDNSFDELEKLFVSVAKNCKIK